MSDRDADAFVFFGATGDLMRSFGTKGNDGIHL